MKSNYKQLGSYIRQVDIRNIEGKEDNLLGVSVQKYFIPSIANTVGTDFTKYKVVRRGQFTYIPDTSRRGDKIAIALLKDHDEGLVSNVYTVFEVTDEEQLLPEYLMLWFSRPEFDRYARFKSHGSVREVMDWDEMCKVELPVPPIEEQRKIVESFNALTKRINILTQINDNLAAGIQALFEKLFQDEGVSLSEILIKEKPAPVGWIDSKIEHYANLQTGPFGTQLHSDEYVAYGTPIINVKNIGHGHVIPDNLDYLSEETCERLSAHRLQYGDIVFGRKGSIDRHAFVEKMHEGWIQGSDCIRVRSADPDMSFYIHCWFSQPVVKQMVISSSVGSTMASLNTKILGDIRLLLPPETKKKKFTSNMKQIMSSIALNQDEIQELNVLSVMIRESLSR